MKYIIKRIVLMGITCFIILSITFILMKLLPAQVSAPNVNARIAFYNQQVQLGYMERVQDAVHYDIKIIDGTNVYLYRHRPILMQYWSWFQNILFHWDWGTSSAIRINEDVFMIIHERLLPTIKVNLIAVSLSLPLGLLLGMNAALHKNTWMDHLQSVFVMLFISIPSFVLLTFILIFFAYQNEWLPSTWPSDLSSPDMKLKGYIIPVICLSFATIASLSRYTRAELCDVLNSDYLMLAKVKGLSERQVLYRHAFKNAMLPLVPFIIGEFSGILVGSMIVEQIYSIPGIGTLFVNALNSKDYNLVMADMALYTFIGLFASLCIDLCYGIIDPRVRIGTKK